MTANKGKDQADREVDVAIIGGGLAGLSAAHVLNQHGVDFQIFEAAERLGGRINSAFDTPYGQYMGDLGATWVWPPFQPCVSDWIKRLKLATYPQYEEGSAVVDMQPDRLPVHQYLPGQPGMARIVGGPQAMIDALAAGLSPERVNINCAVSEIKGEKEHFVVDFSNGKKLPVSARKIIMAAPIRLAAQTIDWHGLLDEETVSIMRNTPTWMATQAKVLISYSHAFWRDQGLSGRIASQVGPMFEVHDHCGADGKPACLFGFIGWSAIKRRDHDMETVIKEQLVRSFGKEAAQFTQLTIKDWAMDRNICSRRDIEMAPAHPQVLNQHIRQGFCDDRLFFAAAETAIHSPGLIDGAFEAGERAAKKTYP